MKQIDYNHSIFQQVCALLFVVLLFMFTFCNPISIKHFMDEDDKVWLDSYDKGDTVCFLNIADVTCDTLIVSDKYIWNPYTRIPLPESCSWTETGTTYNGYGLFGLEFIHAGIKDIGYFIAKKYSNNEPAYLSFSILDNSEAKEQPLRTLTSIEITGHMLNDCIVIDKHSIKAEEHTKTKLNYIVWSKSLGLVEYVTTDGEQYILSTLL